MENMLSLAPCLARGHVCAKRIDSGSNPLDWQQRGVQSERKRRVDPGEPRKPAVLIQSVIDVTPKPAVKVGREFNLASAGTVMGRLHTVRIVAQPVNIRQRAATIRRGFTPE
jgi:hypothetical protein